MLFNENLIIEKIQGGTNGRMDGRTDVRKFTPVSYRTSALWGRCPKSSKTPKKKEDRPTYVSDVTYVLFYCPYRSKPRIVLERLDEDVDDDGVQLVDLDVVECVEKKKKKNVISEKSKANVSRSSGSTDDKEKGIKKKKESAG